MIARRSLLRGASALPFAVGATAALPASVGSNDRRLAVAVDTLNALQAHADRRAADAKLDPADPYNQAVAEMDLVAAEMATLPADTMAGVMTKLRAMQVPIVGQDEDSPLPLSVCRDLRRLCAEGALS